MIRKKTLVFEKCGILRDANVVEHKIITDIPFLVRRIAKERTLS